MSNLDRRSVLAGAVVAGLLPAAARAAARPVRLSNTNPAASPYGQGCRAFAAAVAANPLLQTTLRVEIFDDAKLGDELSVIRAVVNGTIDMAMCTNTVIGNLVPEVGVLDAPFLFKDPAAARKALDGDIGAEFAELLKAKGINLLAWAENGVRHITADRPVRRPADLVGLKLRVPQSEVVLASFRALGADARPFAYNVLYEALRTGQFEAEENPIAVIEVARFYEVQKVLSMTGHAYSAAPVVASQDLLDDLSKEQRAALLVCAKQGAAVSRTVAEAAQHEGVGRLRALGMTVVEDVDHAAFIAASKPALLALSQKFGAERMDRLMQAGA